MLRNKALPLSGKDAFQENRRPRGERGISQQPSGEAEPRRIAAPDLPGAEANPCARPGGSLVCQPEPPCATLWPEAPRCGRPLNERAHGGSGLAIGLASMARARSDSELRSPALRRRAPLTGSERCGRRHRRSRRRIVARAGLRSCNVRVSAHGRRAGSDRAAPLRYCCSRVRSAVVLVDELRYKKGAQPARAGH
eukprot:scaffold479_cov376-Prasinococcus_capsulatus_cf.AAC.5